jgi:peptidylprolyl isomerase
MATAQVGDIVKVSLDAKLDDGTVVVSTTGGEPISFQVGAGEVIPGLENAVIGMTEGDSKTERVPPEEAFGRYSGKRLIVMDRGEFPTHIEPYKGQFLRVKKVDGRTGIVRVALADDSRIMLDANHLLAGKEIILEIELLEVVAQGGPLPESVGMIGPGASPNIEEEMFGPLGPASDPGHQQWPSDVSARAGR